MLNKDFNHFADIISIHNYNQNYCSVHKVIIEVVVDGTVIGKFQEYLKEDTLSLANSLSFYFDSNILI